MGWQAAHVEREKMNAARRARQKISRDLGGGHTHAQHIDLGFHTVIDGKGRHHEVRDPCLTCRPAPQTETQRAARAAQRAAERVSAASRATGMGHLGDFRQMIAQALARQPMTGGSFGRRTSHRTRGYRKVAK